MRWAFPPSRAPTISGSGWTATAGWPSSGRTSGLRQRELGGDVERPARSRPCCGEPGNFHPAHRTRTQGGRGPNLGKQESDLARLRHGHRAIENGDRGTISRTPPHKQPCFSHAPRHPTTRPPPPWLRPSRIDTGVSILYGRPPPRNESVTVRLAGMTERFARDRLWCEDGLRRGRETSVRQQVPAATARGRTCCAHAYQKVPEARQCPPTRSRRTRPHIVPRWRWGDPRYEGDPSGLRIRSRQPDHEVAAINRQPTRPKCRRSRHRHRRERGTEAPIPIDLCESGGSRRAGKAARARRAAARTG